MADAEKEKEKEKEKQKAAAVMSTLLLRPFQHWLNGSDGTGPQDEALLGVLSVELSNLLMVRIQTPFGLLRIANSCFYWPSHKNKNKTFAISVPSSHVSCRSHAGARTNS